MSSQTFSGARSVPMDRNLATKFLNQLTMVLLIGTLAGCPSGGDSPANDNGILTFEKTAYVVAEDAMYVEVIIVRQGGKSGNISVEFDTTPDSATQDIDYEPVSTTLTWADGEDDAAVVRIPIRADLESEPDETFQVVLSNPTGGAVFDNDRASVTIQDRTCSDVSEDITEDVTYPAGCYHVTRMIQASATATMNPGATFLFDPEAGFSFSQSGSIQAVGNGDLPVLFTGGTRQPGAWSGIELFDTNTQQSHLDHVVVEYAGDAEDRCGLRIEGTTQMVLVDSRVQKSAGYGVCMEHDTEVTFQRNVLTQNALGAAWVEANAVGQLDEASTYSGNGNDVVFVVTNTSYVIEDQNWHKIDADYLIEGRLWPQAHLTIEAGARLVFQEGGKLYLETGAALTALGTQDDPVVFTGLESTPGYWQGVELFDTDSQDNRFDHVVVEYGGDEGADVDANVVVAGTSRLEITGSILCNSAGWAVLIGPQATINGDAQDSNSFSGNALGDIHRQQ